MAKLFITTDAVNISNPASILAQQDVSDANVQRVRNAFGHFDNSTPPVWILGTAQDVMDEWKNFLRNRVTEYETAQQANATREAINGETW